jgi:RNA polymerase sigma-70 factor (ECF subfamily)
MQAFDVLAETHRPMVVAYLRSLVGDPDLAEDLAQDVFLAAQQNLGGLREGAQFGAWLRGIARNKALGHHRASSRRWVIADSRVIEGMEEVYAVLDAPTVGRTRWSDRVALLRECAGRLSAHLRAAVEEVYQKGRSLKAAAEAQGASFEALAQRLSRARALIRECVERRLAQEGRP